MCILTNEHKWFSMNVRLRLKPSETFKQLTIFPMLQLRVRREEYSKETVGGFCNA